MIGKDLIRGFLGLSAAVLLVAGLGFGVSAKTKDQPEAAEQAAENTAESTDSDTLIHRQNMDIQFTARPILGSMEEERDIYELDAASISFRITDQATGQPVNGLIPGAWVDLIETPDGGVTGRLPCKERIGLYLRGTTGIQPLIDINSYFILVLNEDATISVIDPTALVGGMPDMFFTQIILPRPGADWAQSVQRKRLYVSMPRADKLAVVDVENFKLIDQVATGAEPVRVALQPDGRYVWVGNNAMKEVGGVTVIDAETLDVVANIETGKGHHEIAFTSDDKTALVTNRDSGTVSIIDIGSLKKLRDISVGSAPISLVYSHLSKAFYVADGGKGEVTVIDGASLDVAARIKTKRGLGPMAMSQDGRWILVTNSVEDMVHIIDASSNAMSHEIAVEGKPFQISTTRSFAYVRALQSERMSMINLAELAKGGKPIVVKVPLGDKPPHEATSLSIADMVVEAAGEAGVVAVDPVGATLNYYMEGMNAPMGSFNSKGHKPRAVLVTDRALLENDPGIYSARVQVPKAGKFEVAFVLDSPPVVHCFTFDALPNPLLKADLKPLAIEYLSKERKVPAGKPTTLRFRLTKPAEEEPAVGLGDVRVLYYRAPGHGRTDVAAREIGDGVYEADINITLQGTYFVYVSSLSANVPPGGLNYITLQAKQMED